MKIFTLAALLSASLSASAQFNLSGTVTDAATGEKLAGATLVIDGSYKSAVSGFDGAFAISDVKPGPHRLRVTYIGYEPGMLEVWPDSGRNIAIRLQRSVYISDEVEIISTRADNDGPISQSNVTSDDIARQNLGQDLPYLLSQTPSVVVNSDAGTGVGYTGIRIRGTDATRINVTMNGIPVNDAESQGVFWVNMPDLASSVSNIQVQRGVGTSTNGPGAFGGTINIQTNQLRANPYATVSSSIGSFLTIKNTVEAGTGLLGKHFAFNARLSKITSDGYVDRAWSDLKSLFLSGGYYGKNMSVKFNIITGQEATYQSWNGVPEYLMDSLRTFNSAGTDEGKRPVPYRNETDNYQQDHYQLFVNRQFGQRFNASLALYYTRGRGYYEQYKVQEDLADYGIDSIFTGNDTILQSDLIRQLWLDNHLYGFTLSANYKHKKWDVTLGGGWNHYIGDHYGNVTWAQYAGDSDPTDRYYDNRATKTDLNVYAKAEFQVVRQVKLFADMQYRMVDYAINGFSDNPALLVAETFHFFNPKAGITYDINSNHHLFAYFGMANKEPNRVDYETAPNQRPTYETLRDFELGYRQQGRIYTFSVNGFFMDYTNQLIQTGKLNDVGAYTRTNVPSSFRAGVEIEAAVKIVRGLRASGNFTFSKNKIRNFTEYIDNYDTGIQEEISHGTTDIAFSPDFIAGMTITYSPVKNLEMDLLGKFAGRQFMDNTSDGRRSLDPFFTNDFRIRYNVDIAGMFNIGFNLMVNNFTNRMYAPNGYTFSYIYGGALTTENFYYPQAGINVLGGIVLSFEKK